MGARQSVAQPPRQRSHTSTSNSDFSGGNSGNLNSHLTNGHNLTEPSTSGEINRNRSSFVLQPTTSTQQQPRARQTRSRSVPMPPQDLIRGMGASTSNATHQNQNAGQLGGQFRHLQQYRAHHFPNLTRDQSSDSSGAGTDNDTPTTGIPSLDRLLRFNSTVNAGGQGTSGVWLPAYTFRHYDVKCPVCNKMVPSDDVEYHFTICLTRPIIAYNEDVLTEDKGECVICFDDMSQGDTIARLPCLCVYHKVCIDSWFKVKNSCPEHPADDE